MKVEEELFSTCQRQFSLVTANLMLFHFEGKYFVKNCIENWGFLVIEVWRFYDIKYFHDLLPGFKRFANKTQFDI